MRHRHSKRLTEDSCIPEPALRPVSTSAKSALHLLQADAGGKRLEVLSNLIKQTLLSRAEWAFLQYKVADSV